MTEDDDIADRLLLPPCRPELKWGIPYRWFLGLWMVWGIGLMWFGAIITGTGICIMIGVVLRKITAIDFNALSVVATYCRTKLLATRSTIWISGITLDPLYKQRAPR
jgi:type IV secretory pathway VirB3-like protein